MTKSDLEVRVAVLEKLFDNLLSASARGLVAEKTADKALAMAQEALAIVAMKPAPEVFDHMGQYGAGVAPEEPRPLRAPPVQMFRDSYSTYLKDGDLSKKMDDSHGEDEIEYDGVS